MNSAHIVFSTTPKPVVFLEADQRQQRNFYPNIVVQLHFFPPFISFTGHAFINCEYLLIFLNPPPSQFYIKLPQGLSINLLQNSLLLNPLFVQCLLLNPVYDNTLSMIPL